MENREDILMIRPEELKRYQLISKVLDKNINQQEAAELLGISDRQVRRIVRRVRVEGERGIIHRLRGRRGCRGRGPRSSLRRESGTQQGDAAFPPRPLPGLVPHPRAGGSDSPWVRKSGHPAHEPPGGGDQAGRVRPRHPQGRRVTWQARQGRRGASQNALPTSIVSAFCT